jgi:hypothetical protein
MAIVNAKGISTVEVLIVATIVVLLTLSCVVALNPTLIVNKGKDAQRKKDLYRIKVAFEDYNGDKGCYPDANKINELNNISNCGSKTIFNPWMKIWPCDPNGTPYKIVTESSSCPKYFKLATNLENNKDNDIPINWYDSGYGLGNLSNLDVNYGVSSSNTTWYEFVATDCTGTCNVKTPDGGCSGVGICKSGEECYRDNDCRPGCGVDSCVGGDD